MPGTAFPFPEDDRDPSLTGDPEADALVRAKIEAVMNEIRAALGAPPSHLYSDSTQERNDHGA